MSKELELRLEVFRSFMRKFTMMKSILPLFEIL